LLTKRANESEYALSFPGCDNNKNRIQLIIKVVSNTKNDKHIWTLVRINATLSKFLGAESDIDSHSSFMI